MASLEADSLVAVKSRISALERTVEQGNNLVLPQRQLDSIKIKKDSIPRGFMAYNFGGGNDRPAEGIYWYGGGEEWRLISDTSVWPVTFSVVSSYTGKVKVGRDITLKVQVTPNAPVNWNDVSYVWTLVSSDGKTVGARTFRPDLRLDSTQLDVVWKLERGKDYDVYFAVAVNRQNSGAPFFLTTFHND
jgi:hypothetical protein